MIAARKKMTTLLINQTASRARGRFINKYKGSVKKTKD